jgi:hypothetical protein
MLLEKPFFTMDSNAASVTRKKKIAAMKYLFFVDMGTSFRGCLRLCHTS